MSQSFYVGQMGRHGRIPILWTFERSCHLTTQERNMITEKVLWRFEIWWIDKMILYPWNSCLMTEFGWREGSMFVWIFRHFSIKCQIGYIGGYIWRLMWTLFRSQKLVITVTLTWHERGIMSGCTFWEVTIVTPSRNSAVRKVWGREGVSETVQPSNKQFWSLLITLLTPFLTLCRLFIVSPHHSPLSFFLFPLLFRHEELLVQGGLYAAMWMKQQKSLDTKTETQINNQTQDTWIEYAHTTLTLRSNSFVTIQTCQISVRLRKRLPL